MMGTRVAGTTLAIALAAALVVGCGTSDTATPNADVTDSAAPVSSLAPPATSPESEETGGNSLREDQIAVGRWFTVAFGGSSLFGAANSVLIGGQIDAAACKTLVSSYERDKSQEKPENTRVAPQWNSFLVAAAAAARACESGDASAYQAALDELDSAGTRFIEIVAVEAGTN